MQWNENQWAAIAHTEGPCLVLAGPGSGKTAVIVNRIHRLLTTGRVPPDRVLVITFTKYAAREMKLRLQALCGGRYPPVTMGTFHSVYYGILRWKYHFGGENILTEKEKYGLLAEIGEFFHLDLFDEADFFQRILSEISRYKSGDRPLAAYQPKACEPALFASIVEAYEKRRRGLRKIDFDDMLLLCRDLLMEQKEILELWQQKFQYILIDEFQDINPIQYQVIKMLAAPDNHLFAVGDDDQSIYGFRGANARLMFQFEKDFPKAKRIILQINYRSTENIVRNAEEVIRKNQLRFAKEMLAQKKAGEKVHVQETEDPKRESIYVVRQIQRRIQAGVPLTQIAVLGRVHGDLQLVADRLLREQIPFRRQATASTLYEHFIARDIEAYFLLATGSRNRRNLLRIMNRPNRYIGRDALEKDEEFSFPALRVYYFGRYEMERRIETLEKDLQWLSNMAPYAAIEYICRKIGYEAWLDDYGKDTGRSLENPKEILTRLSEAAKPFQTLQEWLAHSQRCKVIEKEQGQTGKGRVGVSLLTLHTAKGLEFDTVFIVQANEGKLPRKKALEEGNEEEERRLFYVGMTRAKERLFLTYVREAKRAPVLVSRFIGEMLTNVEKGIE